MAAPKRKPARDFGARVIMRIALPTTSRASPILLLERSLDCASAVATKGTTDGAAMVSRSSWQMTSNLLQTLDPGVEGADVCINSHANSIASRSTTNDRLHR
jgi:hypothetical protein